METPLCLPMSLPFVCLAMASCSTGIPEPSPSIPSVSSVDPDVTPETRNPLPRLHTQEGKGALFGYQHSLSMDLASDTGDDNTSDTLTTVGNHPAVSGRDGLVPDGDEAPSGPDATPEMDAEVPTHMLKRADALGGINMLTMHLPNPVIDEDFYDISRDAVTAVLPDGTRHSDLTARLDQIADAVVGARRPDNTLIPVILHPQHERNGDQFWWNAEHTIDQQYVELFRLTVDYPRDERDLYSLLYTHSPNFPLNADPGTYLAGYPRNDHMGILGYDSYDEAGGGQEWFRSITAGLVMVAGLAGERGKVSVWAESGPYEGTEPDPHWFTSVLGALKANQSASRIAQMLTWASCGHDGREHAYVPYSARGDHPEHPPPADSQVFHDNPSTIFAKEWRR